VEIPKSGGGVRGLGIPNVEDRVVQEAIRRSIEPLFEPCFHPSSHGFRPKRSCHTALSEARQHVEAGHHVVVDLDLSKFFDRVHHQRLMARVGQKVQDRKLLVLLGRLLKSSVLLPNGVLVRTEEGVPQGGPLSPLLSNIVLDELDQELSRRGHRFVRYADDVAIFVRSKRSGVRVMESVSKFIEGRMRLLVNQSKSSVRKPSEGNFLGFRLKILQDGSTEVLLSHEETDNRKDSRINASELGFIPDVLHHAPEPLPCWLVWVLWYMRALRETKVATNRWSSTSSSSGHPIEALETKTDSVSKIEPNKILSKSVGGGIQRSPELVVIECGSDRQFPPVEQVVSDQRIHQPPRPLHKERGSHVCPRSNEPSVGMS
jgi:hypothetical protein